MRDNKGMGLLIIAVVLVVAFSGNAMATVIDVGSAGYSWGTGSGIISWQGYAGETSPAEGSLPISGSEWTYTIQVLTGDLNFLTVHLASFGAHVTLLENPGVETELASPVGGGSSLAWSVAMDAAGTIHWCYQDCRHGVLGPGTYTGFEFYTSDTNGGRVIASIGDGGQAEVLVGGPAVPEPASLLLLGAGLAGLGLWGWKWRREEVKA